MCLAIGKCKTLILYVSKIDPELEESVRNEWGQEAIFCAYQSNARGVAVLFNNNFEFVIKKVKKDVDKNYMLIQLDTQGKVITLLNLYGPNKDSPQFYRNLSETIDDFGNHGDGMLIACGDWNVALNPDIDTKHYLHVNNPHSRQSILQLIVDHNLLDIWRLNNPDKRGFTWKPSNNINTKQSRLDYFLISENLHNFTLKSDIITGYRTDHSAIRLNLKFLESKPGRGYWKCNNSLLQDQQYVQTIKDTIRKTIEQYALLVYNREHIMDVPATEIQFMINDQLFLETLLMEIRGKSISYSSWKKKKDL